MKSSEVTATAITLEAQVEQSRQQAVSCIRGEPSDTMAQPARALALPDLRDLYADADCRASRLYASAAYKLRGHVLVVTIVLDILLAAAGTGLILLMGAYAELCDRI